MVWWARKGPIRKIKPTLMEGWAKAPQAWFLRSALTTHPGPTRPWRALYQGAFGLPSQPTLGPTLGQPGLGMRAK